MPRTSLRAPAEHGESLIEPRPELMLDALRKNREFFADSSHQLGRSSLTAFRAAAKKDLLTAAASYSARYRDVSFSDRALLAPAEASLVIGGHQPTLFHAGVWFKNFYLDSLAAASGSLAINLIIDNDLVGLTKILVPQRTSEGAQFEAVAFDVVGENLPFEMRPILDAELFRSFPQRVARALGRPYELIANQLWSLDTETVGNNLGLRLAAMRHKYEEQAGLRTLELPLSTLSRTKSFAVFFREIARRADEFRAVYNRALFEYRKAYRIRSRSHPVPELEFDGVWTELPFWFWSQAAPQRKRLFVRATNKGLECTDREGAVILLSGQSFEDEFVALGEAGIAIRPRALTTTMFVRLAVADYFLHGIGGAKYDELTGAIMNGFFGLEPPAFGVATATFRLSNIPESNAQETTNRIDLAASPPALAGEIRKLNETIRNLQYHSERFIDSTDCIAQELFDRKRMLLDEKPPAGSQREFRQRIRDVNLQLGERLNQLRTSLLSRRDEAVRELGLARILDTREASFALFPPELIKSLRGLSRFRDDPGT
ncbi:MAG: hypothetical protein ABL888_04810 [Pirellulaceae bacterium]